MDPKSCSYVGCWMEKLIVFQLNICVLQECFLSVLQWIYASIFFIPQDVGLALQGLSKQLVDSGSWLELNSWWPQETVCLRRAFQGLQSSQSCYAWWHQGLSACPRDHNRHLLRSETHIHTQTQKSSMSCVSDYRLTTTVECNFVKMNIRDRKTI